MVSLQLNFDDLDSLFQSEQLYNYMILSEAVQPEEPVGDLTVPWRYLEGIGVKRCFSPFSDGKWQIRCEEMASSCAEVVYIRC